MIVPAMNMNEVEAEIRKDFSRIEKSTVPRLAMEYDRERRKLKIDKSSPYNKIYELKTGGKNRWMIFVQKDSRQAKYKGHGYATYFCIVFYYTKLGLNVCRMLDADGDLEFFYGHFFTRYNERQQLNLPDALSAAKEFFKHNESFRTLFSHFKKEKAQPGTMFAESVCKDGLALGYLIIGTKQIIYRTFISNHLLTRSQRSVQEILNEEEEYDQQQADHALPMEVAA